MSTNGKIPELLIEATKKLSDCAHEIAYSALYEDGPRHLSCDSLHLLKEYAREVNELLFLDGRLDGSNDD